MAVVIDGRWAGHVRPVVAGLGWYCMRVLGIDLAARPEKTYACSLSDDAGALEAEVHRRCDDAQLLKLARGAKKVAIDAPFGWPDDFVDALNAHRVADAWPGPDDEDPDVFRASLSFRATDRVVMHTRRPLSVSTDKIGVTAMRCAHLLHRWSTRSPVDRTGAGRFAEVYPAGALARWGLKASGYKGADHHALDDLLSTLCAALPALRFADSAREMCAGIDDAFDALVAALVARAAWLGLTDGPPRHVRAQARQEGWIRLPAWGSLPFVAGARAGDLVVRPEHALAERLRETGVKVDDRGYAGRLEDALLPTFSAATREAIESDLSCKGGSELVRRSYGQPKFYAAHSSAALAANTFGPFLRQQEGIPIADSLFTGETRLEVECRTGLRGTPPTLDCLVEGSAVLSVESKCVETFDRHTAHFEESYGDVSGTMHKTWRAEYVRLLEDPRRYRYLDAAQLIRHYLGLRKEYSGRAVTFVYLYWVPTNGEAVAPCAIHEAEARQFASRLADPTVRFVRMTHLDLWAAWSSRGHPQWLREHAKALQRRYVCAVT